MSMRKIAAAALLITLAANSSLAESPRLGKSITEADIAAWDLSILGDGTGLPQGSGTATEGATIYAQKCVACHGENGKGGNNGAVDRSIASKQQRRSQISGAIPRPCSISSGAQCRGNSRAR